MNLTEMLSSESAWARGMFTEFPFLQCFDEQHHQLRGFYEFLRGYSPGQPYTP